MLIIYLVLFVGGFWIIFNNLAYEKGTQYFDGQINLNMVLNNCTLKIVDNKTVAQYKITYDVPGMFDLDFRHSTSSFDY